MYNLRSAHNLPLLQNLRSGKKWTIPELISLEREYDLLELTVQEIAQRHNRTVFAVVAKLESEGIIDVNV